MSKKAKTPPRRGSLEDRLIQKHGKFIGGVFVNFIVYLFTFSLIFYLGIVGFSAYIVINSASFLSSTLSLALIILAVVGLYLFLFILVRKGSSGFWDFLKLYFSLQVTLSIMAFIQTTIWMLDWENQFHEPRLAFLAGLAIFLAYFRDRFTQFVERITALRTENSELINPNDETNTPNDAIKVSNTRS